MQFPDDFVRRHLTQALVLVQETPELCSCLGHRETTYLHVR